VQIQVSARHMDVTPPLKQYAELKAAKLDKYFDRIHTIEVVLDGAHGKMKAEMIVTAEHRDRFVAVCDNEDAYACIDACVDKLERQLTDHKKRFRNRKHAIGEDKRTARRNGEVSQSTDDLSQPVGEQPYDGQADLPA
jgi:putative sigma-54 modulation protein